MAKPVPKDPRGHHVRLYKSMLMSHAYRALSISARALYTDLRMKLTATNNGDISAAITDLRPLGWNSPATISEALKELRAAGFIDITRPGGFPARTPTLYRFTDVDVYERRDKGIAAQKATNDYLKFQSINDAKEAIAQKVEVMTQNNRGRQWPKKNRVQKMNAMASESAADTGPEIEQDKPVSVQIMNKKNRMLIGSEPA